MPQEAHDALTAQLNLLEEQLQNLSHEELVEAALLSIETLAKVKEQSGDRKLTQQVGLFSQFSALFGGIINAATGGKHSAWLIPISQSAGSFADTLFSLISSAW